MARFWVGFDAWSPAPGRIVSPSTWVTAKDSEEAERVARAQLRSEVHDGLVMTTCVPFSEEDYLKEMRRLRAYYKSKGIDLDKLN